MTIGKLEEFFKTGQKKRRSDVEILDEIEEALNEGDLDQALLKVGELSKEQNVFIAVRWILRRLWEKIRQEGPHLGTELMANIRQLVIISNTITNREQRALLLSELAIIFYELGDEFNGDLSLKTAMELSMKSPSTVKEIFTRIIKAGHFEKAGYAIKLIRDRERLDPLLSRLSVLLYETGQVERATVILRHINDPLHKVEALLRIAEIELARGNPSEVDKILKVASDMLEKIPDQKAKFEAQMKLRALLQRLEGETTLEDILSRREAPPQ